jgi:hypothetical protein
MRWSKVKQLVEDRMAPLLQRRVEVHSTRYRNDRWQEDSRGWFTVDKREIANYSSLLYPYWGTSDPPQKYVSEKGEFEQALGSMLSLSVNAMLVSENEVLRALAMLDRRLGKRRLRTLHLGDDEHPLVRLFYGLRCEAEGIEKPVAVPSFRTGGS